VCFPQVESRKSIFEGTETRRKLLRKPIELLRERRVTDDPIKRGVLPTFEETCRDLGREFVFVRMPSVDPRCCRMTF